MKYDVFCDESRPDLFCSKSPPAKFLLIGSVWAHQEDRDKLKTAIHALREEHKVGPEFKWHKISTSRLPFYEALISLFIAQGDRLRFRCIAVDRTKVNLQEYHDGDQELGFYKFYYQLLIQWTDAPNEYAIFCDHKRNRDTRRLHVLEKCLRHKNPSVSLQAIQSHESVLIQLSDVLTGAASARLNNSVASGSARSQLVAFLEAQLGRRIGPTYKRATKFNVFAIDPKGGS